MLYAFKNYTGILKTVVAVYTLLLGIIIIYKAAGKIKPGKKIKHIYPIGFVAGFLDSVGGGGWGPLATATLVAGGRNALYTIGSVSLSRVFVAIASTITFIIMIGSLQWKIILWLVIGGLAAAPIGPYLARRIPVKTTMIMLAIVIILISLKQIIF